MNSRQRILAALHRKPVDRLPVDLWVTPEVRAELLRHTGADDELEMFHRLGVDKIVWAGPAYEPVVDQDGAQRSTWGAPMKRVRSGLAEYNETSAAPLADYEDSDALDDYPYWPDPDRYDYAGAVNNARAAQEKDFAVIGPWVSFFEIYCQMRGMENALMDVVAEPDFLNAALDRIEAIQTAMLRRYLREAGEALNLVFISDDMGTQESQLISLDAFREHLQPRIRRWCELVHAHGKLAFFHTDGAARNFIPLLIDAGVDVLNPIQHNCPGMDRVSLKRDFGAQLIFHGGVENQYALPRGTVDEVRAETRACLEILGAGGGYIPCSCHNVQAGTPIENILAMIETVHAYAPEQPAKI